MDGRRGSSRLHVIIPFLLSVMAASSADIRSALSLPERGASAGPSQPQPKKQVARKPEGISRELYSLIGPSAPTLAAQLAKPRLKKKPHFGGGGTRVKWYAFILKLVVFVGFRCKLTGKYDGLRIVLEVMVLNLNTGRRLLTTGTLVGLYFIGILGLIIKKE